LLTIVARRLHTGQLSAPAAEAADVLVADGGEGGVDHLPLVAVGDEQHRVSVHIGPDNAQLRRAVPVGKVQREQNSETDAKQV